MPIQFRCPACERTLSIARRKAGTSVKCPQCAAMVMVPAMAGVAIESSEPSHKRLTVIQPEIVNTSNQSPAKVKTRANVQSSATEKVDSMPLFERPDFESLLNPALAQAKNESQHKPRPAENYAPAPIAPVAPPSEPETPVPVVVDNHLIMSRRKLAMIATAIAVLIGISFVAGYFLASATLPPKKPTNTETITQ